MLVSQLPSRSEYAYGAAIEASTKNRAAPVGLQHGLSHPAAEAGGRSGLRRTLFQAFEGKTYGGIFRWRGHLLTRRRRRLRLLHSHWQGKAVSCLPGRKGSRSINIGKRLLFWRGKPNTRAPFTAGHRNIHGTNRRRSL